MVSEPDGAAITAGIADSTVPTVPRLPCVPPRITTSRADPLSITTASCGSVAATRHLQVRAARSHGRRAGRPPTAAGRPRAPRECPDHPRPPDSIVEFSPDVVEHEPEAELHERARFAEPAVAQVRAATPALKFLDGEPAADLRAQRGRAAWRRPDDAGDVHVIDAHAGRSERQRQAVHHEARVDAGPEYRDPPRPAPAYRCAGRAPAPTGPRRRDPRTWRSRRRRGPAAASMIGLDVR